MNYPKLAEVGVNIKFNENALLKIAKKHFSHYQKNGIGNRHPHAFSGHSESSVKAVLSNKEMKALILRTFGAGQRSDGKWTGIAFGERHPKRSAHHQCIPVRRRPRGAGKIRGQPSFFRNGRDQRWRYDVRGRAHQDNVPVGKWIFWRKFQSKNAEQFTRGVDPPLMQNFSKVPDFKKVAGRFQNPTSFLQIKKKPRWY